MLVVHNLSGAVRRISLTPRGGLRFERILRSTRPGAAVQSHRLRLPPYTSVVLSGEAP